MFLYYSGYLDCDHFIHYRKGSEIRAESYLARDNDKKPDLIKNTKNLHLSCELDFGFFFNADPRCTLMT